MWRRLLSVSGFTLLSRITGLIRDISMATHPGQRPDVRRLPVCVPVSQLFPRHFRRGHHQSRISCRAMPRSMPRASMTPAGRFADRIFSWQMAAQAMLLVAGDGRHAAVWCRSLFRATRRSRRRSDRQPGAHHLSLSDPYRGGDPAVGHAERDRKILGGGGVVEPAQFGDDLCARRVALVSQRGLCRCLGRGAGRRGATGLHAVGGRAGKACICA